MTKTICYANTIDWDIKGLTQRPHHFMRLLSERGYKIIWINQTQRKDKIRDRINEHFEVYHSWDVFLRRNPKVDIYFSSWAARYKDFSQIKADLVVYDSLDNFPENEHQEIKMISRSDIVLAASQPLFDLRIKQHNNVNLCKNACFAEHGKQEYPIPSDLLQLKKLGKPLILFSGAIASWCNLGLIEKVANQYNLVVVGRNWGVPMPKNVCYLGMKTHEELQAYYRFCDVNILPFKRCQVADFSSPIKCFESMIHGTPTVATDIPEAVVYSDVILTSKNDWEFLQNIKKAIKLKNDPEYRELAVETGNKNTWNHRVDVVDQAIRDFFNKRGAQIG